MVWFKVDDKWWAHPKTLSLSGNAKGLWVVAGSWCGANTDGYVPEGALRMFGFTKKHAQELVDAGYWEVEAGGWKFHDWVDYQPTKEDVQDKSYAVKKARSEAGKRGALARWGDGNADGKPDGKANGKPMAKPLANGWQADGKAMAPNPDPDPNLLSSDSKRTAGRRGSRVPDDFAITDDMREWAKREAPLVDVDRKLDEWLDYWRGVAGAAGVKLDWLATWRNGMKKQQGWAERDRVTAPAGKPNTDWMNRSTRK